MDIKDFRPLNDFVLVKIEEELEEGLIKIIDKEKRKQTLGTVISNGEGKYSTLGYRREICVNPGDKILFDRRYADEISLENTDTLLIKEKNIVCVIDAENT